jgi:mono/diheme cytochrome c family protein
MIKWSLWLLAAASAVGQEPLVTAPRIWDDQALEDWATPIAALGIRPGHFTAAEYYAAPVENLKTYPVYRPDREPPGYWEWLQKQKPEPLIDASKLHTPDDWIRAGEIAFHTMDEVPRRTSDPERIRLARDLKSYDGIWIQQDGSLVSLRWVVTKQGVQLTETACTACHTRGQPDGTIVHGAPPKGPRQTRYSSLAISQPTPTNSPAVLFFGDSRPMQSWRGATVPWDPDPRIEHQRTASDAENTEFRRSDAPIGIGVVTRRHGSPFHPTKTPDLNTLRYSRFIDATGTHLLRGPEDVARYSALVMGADSMDFGDYHILEPQQRRVPMRYADEVLYAIGVYLLSLEPPKNPSPAPAALIERGRRIFVRETCVGCHVPPNFTSGKLTLAQGFTPPPDHPNRADILNRSVGTDPGLALHTRKGTGFYKIPSLRGLWYRSMLLHDGSVGNLEEMFDPDRLKPEHVPGGWPGPGVTKRAIPGHPFGLGLNADDKAALLAFLRSL